MINLQAGINKTGYGIVAKNIFQQLWKHNTDKNMCLFPIGSAVDVDNNQQLIHDIQSAINNQYKFSSTTPSLKIWHQGALFDRHSSFLAAGLTFFELDRLTPTEIASINGLDLLFVASSWAKNIVDKHCKTKTVVLPIGVDRTVFYPDEPADDDTYRFFTCGKLEIRKGHDILIKIFERAFNNHDNVELHIKWDNPFMTKNEMDDWKKLYRKSPLADKIVWHSTTSQSELARLMTQCNCGIFPTRSEGFGMSLLEMMACNRPIITTNYSAPTQFCNDQNAFLVDPAGMTEAIDGRWFNGEGRWALLNDSSIDEFATCMKHCYDQRITTNKEGLNTTSLYNWNFAYQVLKSQMHLVDN